MTDQEQTHALSQTGDNAESIAEGAAEGAEKFTTESEAKEPSAELSYMSDIAEASEERDPAESSELSYMSDIAEAERIRAAFDAMSPDDDALARMWSAIDAAYDAECPAAAPKKRRRAWWIPAAAAVVVVAIGVGVALKLWVPGSVTQSESPEIIEDIEPEESTEESAESAPDIIMSESGTEYSASTLIVTLSADTTDEELAALCETYDLEVTYKFDSISDESGVIVAVSLSAPATEEELAALKSALEEDPAVLSVEYDYILHIASD